MNLRRLNYILIPQRPETIERLQRGPAAWLTRPFAWLWEHLTYEGRVVGVVMLISGVAGVDVRFSNLYMVFCGLLGLLLAAFLTRPLARLERVVLRVEHPPRVTAGEPITFTAVLRNEGKRTAYALRVHGPFLPWDGEWVGPLPAVRVLEPGQEVRVPLQATFLCRGQRTLGRFTLCSILPFGLTLGRHVKSPKVSCTVVPRCAPLQLGPLPRMLRHQHGSMLLGGGAGDSLELLGIRRYRPGDRLRDLHARSWARLGQPMVKEYRQEVFQRATVVLDTRRAAAEETFDAAVELSAGLLSELQGEGETLVDLVVLGVPALELSIGCHTGTMDQALDLLATVRPTGRQHEAEFARGQLAPYLSKTGLLCFVLLRWDEQTAELLQEARSQGAEVRACLVEGPTLLGSLPAAARPAGAAAAPADVQRVARRRFGPGMKPLPLWPELASGDEPASAAPRPTSPERARPAPAQGPEPAGRSEAAARARSEASE